MASLVVLFVLGFVAGIYSAPDDSASIVISSEDNNTKELDDVVEGIIKKIATNDTAGAEKSFRDFIDKAVKAESRVSDSTIVDDSDENSETKEIRNVLKHVIIKIAKDGKGAEKKIREILEAAANTGQIDRSFVSDLINSTLGGVHMGLSIGSNNGTSNQLCIKLGNIVMSGCRRAVTKEIINDNNRTMINPEKKVCIISTTENSNPITSMFPPDWQRIYAMVLQLFMGGGDHFQSGEPYDRLPPITEKLQKYIIRGQLRTIRNHLRKLGQCDN